LAKVGEHFINNAKSLPQPPREARGMPHQPNYIDLTAALRNANSYEVYKKGSPVIGNVNKNTKALFNKTKAANTDVELLLGNGMIYASTLERHGYDVNSSSQLKAEEEIKHSF